MNKEELQKRLEACLNEAARCYLELNELDPKANYRNVFIIEAEGVAESTSYSRCRYLTSHDQNKCFQNLLDEAHEFFQMPEEERRKSRERYLKAINSKDTQ